MMKFLCTWYGLNNSRNIQRLHSKSPLHSASQHSSSRTTQAKTHPVNSKVSKDRFLTLNTKNPSHQDLMQLLLFSCNEVLWRRCCSQKLTRQLRVSTAFLGSLSPTTCRSRANGRTRKFNRPGLKLKTESAGALCFQANRIVLPTSDNVRPDPQVCPGHGW